MSYHTYQNNEFCYSTPAIVLYKNYLQNIQMEERAPNQYKPTFFEKVFSVILPVPTRRILSDKKIDKKKKINLSLTNDRKNKSTKMLTVSSSFLSKATPTDERNNYFLSTNNQTYNTSTLKDNQFNHHGLHFHPRKINFHHQTIQRQKIKSRLVNATVDLANKQQNKQMLILNPKKGKKQKQTTTNFHSLRQKRIPAFFKRAELKKQQRYSSRKPQNPQFNQKHNRLSLDQSDLCSQNDKKQLRTSSNIQKTVIKQKEKRALLLNAEQFSKFQSILPRQLLRQKQTINKQQKLNYKQIQQLYESNKPKCPQKLHQKFIQASRNYKNPARLKEKQCPINKKLFRQSDIHLSISDQQVEPHYQTPRISRIVQNKLHLQQNTKQQIQNTQVFQRNKNNNQKLQIRRPISNLFTDVMTIQSKGDQSSQKSGSECYSNVIFRMNGDDFKQNKLQIEPRDWDQPRRHTLKTNLIQKFQQIDQQINKTQNPNYMNFKKKKSSLQQKMLFSQYPDNYTNAQISNLKYLQQKYITKQEDYKYQNSSIQITEKLNKFKNIYEYFNKINYLGVGRFASVYLCSLPDLNFIFAMKQILKFTVKCNSIENQLQKQILIQYECNHPNIINLYHAWSDQKKYYLALQYGQETLLSRIQKNNYISQLQSIKFLYEIAKGLSYLHDKAIVHRDIKPQNIIIVNGVCKIGDFGWSSSIQSGILNQACGTPCYISPQMQKCQLYTTKTDCWSLGILAYQLINGKLNQQYFGRQSISYQKLVYRQEVSSQYKRLVSKLLQKQQQNRPSIRQILTLPIFIKLN